MVVPYGVVRYPTKPIALPMESSQPLWGKRRLACLVPGLLLLLVAHVLYLSSLGSTAHTSSFLKYEYTDYADVRSFLESVTGQVSGISKEGDSGSLMRESFVVESDTLKIWQYNNPFFQTATYDAFCHGCRTQNDNPQKQCATRQGLLQGTTSITNLSKDCQSLCLACPNRDHWYGRPDEAAPPIQYAVSHLLSSIPEQHRLPRDPNATNLLHYFQTPGNAHPHRSYFNEYNPSIVQIPTSQIPPIYRNESIVYLASFRVTNVQFCLPTMDIHIAMMGGKDGVWPSRRLQPRWVNHLGLALLREDLSIVADAVFHLANKVSIEDSRLFNLYDRLYWTKGATLYPIGLVPADKNAEPSGSLEIEPLFQSATWSGTKLYFTQREICPSTQRNIGKNLQFFVDPSDGAVLSEIYPTGEKIELNLSSSCPDSVVGAPRPRNITIPNRSFGTIDELHFFEHDVPLYSVLTGERGSYCCASMDYQNKEYLLGISHSKFRFRSKETRDSLPGNVSANHFFSTFYLMEPGMHTVVARTGKFCLGFPDTREVEHQNPYGRFSIDHKLRLGYNYFDCPKIHFVSGLVDTPDGDHVILSYGVADCSPRMVKVRKADILRMLFPFDENDS